MDLQNWSWLSSKSPLLGSKTETEWILERLSAALERELNRQRKGYKKQPPISMAALRRGKSKQQQGGEKQEKGTGAGRASGVKAAKEEGNMRRAVRGEE
jgi:potassium channel subfamily K, other eukaryote